MTMALPNSCHSAEGQLRLICGDHSVPLGQVGPDYGIVEEPTLIPPGDGVIEIIDDGKRFAREVVLPDGLAAGSPRFRFDTAADWR